MSEQISASLRARPDAVERFRRDRFGMFIHWGLYALLERGEWVMHRERIPVADYEALAGRFAAERFDADAWAGLAAEAGQRYLVITSKHHDGFCLFDTARTDYKVTRTPFGRDPLAELADACRRAGVRLGFYHSLLDWHHPDYGRDWAAYRDYLHGQVRELCTNYGPVCEIWFDGHWLNGEQPKAAWFRPTDTWDFPRLYDMIHTLQPDCLIGNNHHGRPLAGEDIQIFEQDLPGENSAGFNEAAPADLPLETCITINRSWGYRADDAEHKSVEQLAALLDRCGRLGCNLLLNVGPRPDGTIPEPHVERLRALGRRGG